ncbi:MAG: queuosine precursor transporter [bacterium]|nr:queuosine precursor transporter [bacterium]
MKDRTNKPEIKYTTMTVFVSAAFIAATMTANIMSLRMIAPLGLVMDAGTLLYPITFVLRDILHRKAGLRAANNTITASVLTNIAMFSLFAITSWMPADMGTGPQTEFALVLMPGFLIVAGSVVAQFIAERIDGRIFQHFYRNGEGSHIKAAFISNLISIPLDSVIMCSIAFGFTIPFESLVLTIGSNILMKYVVMLVALGFYAIFPDKDPRNVAESEPAVVAEASAEDEPKGGE